VKFTTPFIEVSSEEVHAGMRFAYEVFPLETMSTMTVMRIANRLGARLHDGMTFETARARSLKAGLAPGTTPGTAAYRAHDRAITKIFSNRRKLLKQMQKTNEPVVVEVPVAPVPIPVVLTKWGQLGWQF